jgi:type III restriction enzyme
MGFTDSPIINSPFDRPKWHFELDGDGQPTGKRLPDRRKSVYVVPVPAARRRSGQQGQLALEGEETTNVLVNKIRQEVDKWRDLPPGKWGVAPETQRLLLHWRDNDRERKLFFCQREAVETLIWLTEVAPKEFRDEIEAANVEANPGLYRLACKMATGAGKTTVMAMIIAWHAVNRARKPLSRSFSDAFLIVTPGITIKDRLRVLKPQDPLNVYQQLDLVPRDMMDAVLKARIVITNYHSFILKEKEQVSKLNRQILGGRAGEKRFTETVGEMVARVCREGGAELMGRKNIIVLNDEAHHCYRHKVTDEEDEPEMSREERDEAEENSKAARVWISGLEAFAGVTGIEAIYDLSATPFFLRGSGYPEGRLFPWVVSDFGLMDAIESGIVKVPRLPVVDDAIKGDLPKFRDVYNVIREENPRAFPMKGRRKGGAAADPSKLPHHLLEAALKDALYKHYEDVFKKWEAQPELGRPPVFIVVCNNTATSKLIYDWISGYEVTDPLPDPPPQAGEGRVGATSRLVHGRLPLFSNVENGRWRTRFRTFLIDSSQLESGEALSDDFRKVAAREIEEFKREKQARGESTEDISDADLLREVMNTIGRPGRLGADIRCVVSVSMLTEGWDANTVTHIMGVRAFGTQLLCEQVVGRGLRRVSYEVDPATGFFPVEYAEVLGVPFSFARGGSGGEAPQPPPRVTRVKALEERTRDREIRFPNVEGYRVVFPRKPLRPVFTKDSGMELDPNIAPNVTEHEPLIGEGITFDLRQDAEKLRLKSVIFDVAGLLLREKFRDEDGNLEVWRYPELVRITEQWFDECLTTRGKTPKQYLKWRPLAQRAVDHIYRALVGSLTDPADGSRGLLLPIVNPLNPESSTRHVRFDTTRQTLIPTTLSHVNYVVYDKDWEAGFTERLEKLGDVVLSYVKNHSLFFEVPYEYGGDTYRYRPDFIVRLGGDGAEPLNLVVEVKGQRDAKDAAKADTMSKVWVPAVNNARQYGRWDYLELTDIPYDIEDRLRAFVRAPAMA